MYRRPYRQSIVVVVLTTPRGLPPGSGCLSRCVSPRSRAKSIWPVYLDIMLHVRGKVLVVDTTEDGMLCTLDVWCEDEKGAKLVVGHAKVEVEETD